MACCKTKKSYTCLLALLAVVAILLSGTAYLLPGWLMLERSLTTYDTQIFKMEIDELHEDMPMPVPSTGAHARPDMHGGMDDHGMDHDDMDHDGMDHDKDHHGMGPHGKDHHGDRHHADMFPGMSSEMYTPELKERVNVETWFFTAIVDIHHVRLRVNYGLWFSTICVHEKHVATEEMNGVVIEEEDDIEEDMVPRAMSKRSADSDSDSSSDEDGSHEREGSQEHHHGGKHEKCKCMRVSTRCALYYGGVFDQPEQLEQGKHGRHGKSTAHLAKRLTEYRVETTMALCLLIIGLIAAIVGSHKQHGYAVVASFIMIVFSGALNVIPMARFIHMNISKDAQALPVYVHQPVSVICVGMSVFVSMVIAVITVIGFRMLRNKGTSKWYQINNELELPSEKKDLEEKKAGPQLVFITEPLPEKPGM